MNAARRSQIIFSFLVFGFDGDSDHYLVDIRVGWRRCGAGEGIYPDEINQKVLSFNVVGILGSAADYLLQGLGFLPGIRPTDVAAGLGDEAITVPDAYLEIFRTRLALDL